MDNYLREKFVGKYRVLAHLDLEKHDFPRNANQDIDSCYADFYIPCRGDTEIHHGIGDNLWIYFPRGGIGKNVLRSIYKENFDDGFEESKLKDKRYYDKLISMVESTGLVSEIEILDNEVDFFCPVENIDVIAKFISPRTSGAKIDPLSTKNLMTSKYNIPEKDMMKYDEVVKHLPHVERTMRGRTFNTVNPYIMKTINAEFKKEIQKKKGKNFSIKSDMVSKGLKGKEYIHSIGMWKEYLQYIKDSEYYNKDVQ